MKPVTNILVPSALKANPVVLVSWELISKLSTKEAVETSKPVVNVYSLTSSPIRPVTNILVPSVLKANPVGRSSCLLISKLSTNDTPANAIVLVKKSRSVSSFLKIYQYA